MKLFSKNLKNQFRANSDRKVADKRIYPALDITRSGTRREELLFEKDDLLKNVTES